jgi:hypothetical protein
MDHARTAAVMLTEFMNLGVTIVVGAVGLHVDKI